MRVIAVAIKCFGRNAAKMLETRLDNVGGFILTQCGLMDLLFSLNSVSKPRMLSVRADDVLSSPQVTGLRFGVITQAMVY